MAIPAPAELRSWFTLSSFTAWMSQRSAWWIKDKGKCVCPILTCRKWCLSWSTSEASQLSWLESLWKTFKDLLHLSKRVSGIWRCVSVSSRSTQTFSVAWSWFECRKFALPLILLVWYYHQGRLLHALIKKVTFSALFRQYRFLYPSTISPVFQRKIPLFLISRGRIQFFFYSAYTRCFSGVSSDYII